MNFGSYGQNAIVWMWFASPGFICWRLGPQGSYNKDLQAAPTKAAFLLLSADVRLLGSN